MEWKFEHSVDCPVSPECAWQFWSHVENWLFDVSVEAVTLDGPFAAGTTGTTKPRDGDPLNWQLIAVEAGHGAVVEINLPGAVIHFHWRFEELPNAATRISQVVTMTGEGAADYLEGAKQLEWGIPEGMRKLVEEIVKAAPQAAH